MLDNDFLLCIIQQLFTVWKCNEKDWIVEGMP